MIAKFWLKRVVFRTPTFRDEDMLYRLPRISQTEVLSADLICRDSQMTQNQTMGSPMLSARAGDTVLLMYQENGHVTKIDDDPNHNPNQTINAIIVYGTLTSSPTDKFLDIIHSKVSSRIEGWRAFEHFDDGHCYQDNGTPKALLRKSLPQRPHLDVEGNDLWCGIDVTVPEALTLGSLYTLYWIWNFNGVSNGDWTKPFTEIYTTCLDILIV